MPRRMNSIEETAAKTLPVWLFIFAVLILPIANFVIEKGSALLTHNESIATKPYVDDKAAEVTAAAKIREQTMFDKAVEHSDRNHDDMVSRMKDISSDTRALGLKIDAVHELITTDHDESLRERRIKK